MIAVERDPRRVGSLTARFAGADVRVVHGDIRTVPLPRWPYRVVASIPFAISTVLLRRLLDPPVAPLLGADLVVEWGLARRLTQSRPRDLGVAWWAARYELRQGRRIPAGCFDPPPAVDAAHAAARGCRPRRGAGAVGAAQRRLRGTGCQGGLAAAHFRVERARAARARRGWAHGEHPGRLGDRQAVVLAGRRAPTHAVRALAAVAEATALRR